MLPSETLLKEENEKLNKRLLLLRDEYVKLQSKHMDLQARFDRLASTTSLVNGKCDSMSVESLNTSSSSTLTSADNEYSVTFVTKILEFVSSLFNSQAYSDLKVSYKNGELFAHKFVLQIRSNQWGVSDLSLVSTLAFPDLDEVVAFPLFQWIYTGQIAKLNDKSDDFLLELVKYAVRFNLTQLIEQCEEVLIGHVRVDNCIYFYQVSEEFCLSHLCEYSSKLVTVYWDTLAEQDFSKASIQFLHRLFKEKSRFPLHKAIRIHNEDLMFLLLVDFDSQLSFKVNEFDNLGHIPLDLALSSGQYSIAESLIKHQANVNAVDSTNWPLLHRYIVNGQLKQAKFLIDYGCSVTLTNPNGDLPMHHCANYTDEHNINELVEIFNLLISKDINLNSPNNDGDTALHRCVISRNHMIFNQLLSQVDVDYEIRNEQYETPFALALAGINDDDYFANRLFEKNVALEMPNPVTGDLLLHTCVRNQNEKAALFLVDKGANVNAINKRGETTLHLASYAGLKKLVSVLLERNANCNMLTLKNSNDDSDYVYNQSPLHLAILGQHQEIIKQILSYHDRASRKGLLDSILLTPDLNIKNSQHQTPLALAIGLKLMEVAELLINSGANVDVRDEEGCTLLHRAIMGRDCESAHFLLIHGADVALKSFSGDSYLQYAVRYRLTAIVKQLCTLGCDVNVCSGKNPGDVVLWEALHIEDDWELEMASILVQHNCDTDRWHTTEEGFDQTLLHRALDENNQKVAVFLIRSGCDIHAIRKPGPNGEGGEYCDKQSPLHMACSWGMSEVVEALLEYSADSNCPDSEGVTPLHLAILNQSESIIDQLIQYPPTDLYKADNFGNSPFSLAIKLKSKSTAHSLYKRDPMVAEQRDGKGRNYLHTTLEKSDYDSLLFLLDNKIDVNTRVEDSIRKAPIHLAAETGSEIILRTLVLAGCNLNDLTTLNQSALHLAAELNNYSIVEILLDMNIDASVQDHNGNTAFHIACLRANKETCELMKTSDIRQTNTRGQNILHCLALAANKCTAASIFELLITEHENIDLDTRDGEGNTPLLLAYMNGNSKLCRALVREGAALGMRNLNGVSLFNHVMPTRQLLTSLLDSLTRMPKWLDGSECLECGQKFSITNRRHHCRHCGRELCAKCSQKEIIIMKFQQEKKSQLSRVCDMCFDVLSVGVFQ